MKKILFISYANDNLDKVKLIKKELADHPFFEPLIVAFNREPNKALIRKVTEAINSSFVVIPILTRASIKAQWINQEIGYSEGKNIPIYPIVENNILDDLKGFIHKQNDIPYTYHTASLLIGQENKSFMNTFRILLKDLENKHSENANIENTSNYGLHILDEMKVEKVFNRKRFRFLESEEGRDAAKGEFLKMINLLKILQKEYRGRGIRADIENDKQDIPQGNKMAYNKITFRAKGYSFAIVLVFYKTKSTLLYVEHWRGLVRLDKSIDSYDDFLNEEDDNQYMFDQLKDFSFSWRSNKTRNYKNTTQIVEMCAKWIAIRIKESNI